MRQHQQIISDAGGPTKVGQAIKVDPNTVKGWARTNSIPGKHWADIAASELDKKPTLDELALAAKHRIEPERLRQLRQGQEAAA